MLEAEGRDARVVHPTAGHLAIAEKAAEVRPVIRTLGEQDECRTLEPCIELSEGLGEGRRGVENPRMRDDRKELVNTRPRNAPAVRTLSYSHERLRCCGMKRMIPAMRVDEDVRVDRDHAPRPL